MNKEILQEIEALGLKTRIGAIKNLPKMFFFSDRNRIFNVPDVVKNLPDSCAVIIREYDLGFDERAKFCQEIILIAKNGGKNLKVLVGKDWNLAEKIGADGVHFSDLDRGFANPKNLPENRRNMILSYSCHSPKSINQAEKFNANLVFYSPIFASRSHLNQPPIGLDGLRSFIKKTTLPVYVLGGVNEKNIKLLRNINISGVGGISMFL